MRPAIRCAAIAVTLIGCTPPHDTPHADVTVFAAASVVTALDGIVADFESGNDVDISVSYAGSATLARQIVSGADADVFVSASLEWADEVARSRPVKRRDQLLGNSLTLIVPKQNPAEITSPRDLAIDRVLQIAIGEPESVPAGKYAREALSSLGLWDALQPKLVYTMDVRQALLYAERGEVDAAIVYATDAADSQRVTTIATMDDALLEPVRYSFVLLESDRSGDAAAMFFDYLLSSESAKRFTDAGFAWHPDSPRASE